MKSKGLGIHTSQAHMKSKGLRIHTSQEYT